MMGIEETDLIDLEKIIKIVENSKDFRKEELDQLVRYVGWQPESHQGQLLAYCLEREIKLMKGESRKNKEPYSMHTILAAREVSRVAGGKTTDITMVLGALFHDDVEEDEEYIQKKDKYVVAGADSEREKIIGDIEEVKKRCLDNLLYFFGKINTKLVANSGLDLRSVLEIVDGLTKRPDEYYYKYLERIFGRNTHDIPQCNPLLNILRMSIIKTAGDRPHNNMTIPREEYHVLDEEYPKQKNRFTIPQRLKECYKSLMTINRAVNFMREYPEARTQYPAYFTFLRGAKDRLIEVGDGVVVEDITYLADIINPWAVQRINELLDDYNDYKIRAPTIDRELIIKPEKIFDGTLARYDTWVKKEYRYGIEKTEDIRLNEYNKKWMEEQLGVTEPKMMLYVQEFLDAIVFDAVFKRFRDNPSFKLEGFGDIND